MPGFNIGGGAGPSATVKTRRKNRWRWKVLFGAASNKWHVYAIKASRPTIKHDQPEVHYINEHIYLAGKRRWEPINISFYDVFKADQLDTSRVIFSWAAKISGETRLFSSAHVRNHEFKEKSELELLDAKGTIIERWELYNSWPASVNWRDLDYESSEILLVEVELRFDKAIRTDQIHNT